MANGGAKSHSGKPRMISEGSAPAGAESAEELLIESPAPAARAHARAARVRIASAVLLAGAAGAAAAVVASRGARRGEHDSVSVAMLSDGLNVQYRTGCKNWESLLMSPVGAARGATDHQACFDACKHTIGCVQANFQTNNCQTSNGSGYLDHQCNLYRDVCETEVNMCWDLMSMRVPTASRTGCTNFADIQIGLPLVAPNLMDCLTACGNTYGCVAVNYQPGNCSGVQKIARGACYLFSDRCERTYNACWDLYEVGSPASAASAIARPATITANASTANTDAANANGIANGNGATSTNAAITDTGSNTNTDAAPAGTGGGSADSSGSSGKGSGSRAVESGPAPELVARGSSSGSSSSGSSSSGSSSSGNGSSGSGSSGSSSSSSSGSSSSGSSAITYTCDTSDEKWPPAFAKAAWQRYCDGGTPKIWAMSAKCAFGVMVDNSHAEAKALNKCKELAKDDCAVFDKDGARCN